MKTRPVGKAGSIAVLALCAGAAASVAQTPTAIPQLDQKRFEIPWYEIARYPDRDEKKCVSDATVLFAEGDKTFHMQIVSACTLKDGAFQVRNRNARAVGKSWNGRLQVTSWPIFLFAHKYLVLAVDPDYTWALVGTPNRKELWVLSKTPTMNPEVLSQIESTATANGFDAGKLATVNSNAGNGATVARVTPPRP
jgi:apolipoprotein D and lipocalin family protein